MAIKAGQIIEHLDPPKDGGAGGTADVRLKVRVGNEEREYTAAEAQAELARVHEWNRTNTERAEQNKREFESIQAERDALRREREQLSAERGVVFDRLAAPPAEPEKPAPSVTDLARSVVEGSRIREIDLTSDPEANAKLEAGLVTALAGTLEGMQREFETRRQREREQDNADWDRRLKTVQGETSARLSEEEAKRQARERNDRLFNGYLDEKYPDLTKDERVEVERKFRQKIGPEYGTFDPTARAFLWNEQAVEDAVRSSKAFDRLTEARITERVVQEKRGWLSNRLDQQEAGSATPRLGRAAVATPADEAFYTKVREVNAALNAGTIQRQQVGDYLTADELRRWNTTPEAERKRVLAGVAG